MEGDGRQFSQTLSVDEKPRYEGIALRDPYKTRPALLAATFFNPDSNQSAEAVTRWGG